MLQEDPVLFQLYKDLVVSQVISAEEFWANRLNLNASDNSAAPNKQDVGISAAFLVCSFDLFGFLIGEMQIPISLQSLILFLIQLIPFGKYGLKMGFPF